MGPSIGNYERNKKNNIVCTTIKNSIFMIVLMTLQNIILYKKSLYLFEERLFFAIIKIYKFSLKNLKDSSVDTMASERTYTLYTGYLEHKPERQYATSILTRRKKLISRMKSLA